MIPVLHAENAIEFHSNGIGLLRDALRAEVFQRLNGSYELELEYPADGLHAEHIKDRRIIMAKPDPVTDPQPFRIYRINPVSNGTISVYARHLAYDLMGIPASPFIASSAADAMNSLKTNAAVSCPFTFSTDKSTAAKMSSSTPKSIWKLLGGSEGSILDIYGGEYEFNRYKVILHKVRGLDRGVVIRYGKNLTTLEQDRNCANVYTGVYPFWTGQNGDVILLPEKILNASGVYNFTRILDLDLTSKFEETPSESQLRAAAEDYMTDNRIGIPDISLTVEFVQLEKTEEYKGTAILERVLLGDSVSVVFPSMRINTKARAVEIRFDPILERYNSITLGKLKATLADTIVSQQEAIKNIPSKESMYKEISDKLAAAMGVSGGCVRLLDNNADGNPDELYIADKPDPADAVKVWRFNYAGWAASKNGYNGPFELGATLEDGLLANFVTAAHLVAGTIQSRDGNFFIDLDTGVINITILNDAVKDLEAKITANAEEIKLKVSKGQVSSQIGVESDEVNVGTNRFVINSTNFKLNKQGNVVAGGSITSVNGSNSAKLDSGGVRFYDDATEIAKIIVGKYGNKSAMMMDMILNGIVFGIGDSPKMIVNNGLNPGGRTEDVVLNNVLVNDHLYSPGQIVFRNSSGASAASIFGDGTMSNETGTFRMYHNGYVHGDLYVNGDLEVSGYNKNRVVDTANYGRVALYCVESASPFFCDMGSVTLDGNGYGAVWLDPVFSETVDLIHDYLVFASAGEVQKHTDYFEVTGRPNTCIDWIVYYRQRGTSTSRLDMRPTVDAPVNPQYLEIDESVFQGETETPAVSEMLMAQYPDTIEADAEAYLENYEKEIYGYD